MRSYHERMNFFHELNNCNLSYAFPLQDMHLKFLRFKKLFLKIRYSVLSVDRVGLDVQVRRDLRLDVKRYVSNIESELYRLQSH